VIHSFGGKTLAIVPSGGKSGGKFDKLLKASGFPVETVAIKQELRTNLTISDKHGLTVKLNEVGPAISPKELGLIQEVVAASLSKATWLMICGSIPPGVSAHFYNGLIELAARRRFGPCSTPMAIPCCTVWRLSPLQSLRISRRRSGCSTAP
jgi:Fructose-1-phosphate kinase and related fructose-6-phosphate kinase (PfkB)